MARPQQRELARNEKVPALSPDASETELSAQQDIETGGRTGPVPTDNLPGHHPDEEQDKPDGDDFLRKMQGGGRAKKATAKKKAAAKGKAAARKADAQKTSADRTAAKKAAPVAKPVAKKAAAPVKKAQPAPEPAPVPAALAGMPSGDATTARTPHAAASTAASTTRSGGVELADVRDVALKVVFWPVTVGVWAGKQVIRRVRQG